MLIRSLGEIVGYSHPADQLGHRRGALHEVAYRDAALSHEQFVKLSKVGHNRVIRSLRAADIVGEILENCRDSYGTLEYLNLQATTSLPTETTPS